METTCTRTHHAFEMLGHNSEADLLIGIHAVSAMFQLHSGGFSKIILILTIRSDTTRT